MQEAVEQLYWLNTHYFESHDVESAERKDSDVREKMKETLSLLDTLQGGSQLSITHTHHTPFYTDAPETRTTF